MFIIYVVITVLVGVGSQETAVRDIQTGIINIGLIVENAKAEKDGEEHIEGYFNYLHNASGDPSPKSLNITTFRMDVVKKERSWRRFIHELNSFTDLAPAMIIGEYLQEVDQLIPSELPYFVTGRKAFLNNVDIKRSKVHKNNCWVTSVGGNVISLLPPLNTFLTPLQKYMFDASWPDGTVVVIVESEDELMHFNSGLSPGENVLQYVRIIVRKEWEYWPRMDKLVAVQKLAISHIVIHSYDVGYIKMIIDLAKELNMVSYLYRWFLTYPDIKGIGDELSTLFLNQYSNVTGFQLIDSSILGQAMSLRGNGFNHAIFYDTMKVLVDTLTPRLNVTPTIDDLIDTFQNGFSGSTGLYGDVRAKNPMSKQRQFCRVRSHYNWMAFEGGEFNQIGRYMHDDDKSGPKLTLATIFMKWQKPMPFGLKTADLKYHAKPKIVMPIFNNMPISVTAVDDPPMIIRLENGTFTGLMVDYLKEYAKKLNFTFEITKLMRHDEGGGGRRFIVGTNDTMMTGAVRDILEQEAVLAIGAIGSTIKREIVMDFSETTLPGVISMMAKKPEIAYDTWQFLSPFTWRMWLGIGGVLIIVSIVVTFLDLLDRTTHDFKNFPVRDSFYYIAAILFFGSTDQFPKSAPMRLLVGFAMFFAIVVSQSYVANMAAFLTTRGNDESLPTSIDALSRQNVVPFGLMASGEAMEMLSRATKGPYLYLWDKLGSAQDPPSGTRQDRRRARIFYDYKEAIAAVKNGSFILISESPITKYFVHKDCDLVVVDQDTDAIRYSIGMPKGALFRRELDRVITAIREEVTRDIQIMEKWYAAPDCAKGGGDSLLASVKTRPLLWEEMKGLFITLGIGAGLALVAAIIGQIKTGVRPPNSKQKAELDGKVRRNDEPPPFRKPANSEVSRDGGTDDLSTPGSSIRMRPLQMTPMARPRSQRSDSDEEKY